jgi:hypothetical protein
VLIFLLSQESLKVVFDIEPECSATLKKICHCANEDIVDLRPKSAFFKNLPSEFVEQYHQEMEDKTANLIPHNVHQFLVDFFSNHHRKMNGKTGLTICELLTAIIFYWLPWCGYFDGHYHNCKVETIIVLSEYMRVC